ncbi:MAG: chemotaxis protein CheX [Desulfobacter postgatei]|uniref:Chemotaxis protein CheX n=1 Tax=Desulfobacter postgatei TaxID=2293 RepID=A0A2G6MRR7_9BACT|nr:MAG: chemotaxis protein CheX [Desulfobacter postgatei]
MDVALVNPFIEGTLHILDTTALIKVKPGPPFLKGNTIHNGDISGLLTVGGDLEATVAISFTEKSILGIVSAMFGEELTEINEEIIDAVGEISNMVAGHVTTKIGELGKKVKVKLVNVVTGRNEEILHTESGSHVVVIPFYTTKGKVLLEVCYSDQSA